MVTASHNPAADNGVKLVDPMVSDLNLDDGIMETCELTGRLQGEMLEVSFIMRDPLRTTPHLWAG